MALDSIAAPSPGEALPTVEIDADIASSFTYASYHNAIPVLRSVAIACTGSGILQNCTLDLESVPPFLRRKRWTIDRLVAGDTVPLVDRKVELDAQYLAGLNEAERGEISLRLSVGDTLHVEKRIPVRLLARDEWGGVADMAQLLPAFVMPNDPAVAAILRSAADRLAEHGHPSALDGYQSGSPQRAFLLAAAVYSAIAGLAIHYAEPPASFEERGQKVRRPTTIAGDRLGTCLDTSLLFAAALEAAGLHPVVFLFQGHAAAGVWLAARTFSSTLEPDPMEVRKALASSELLAFETTGITHRPAMTLEAARHTLAHRFEETEATQYSVAVDIRRARSGGITPLASHEARQAGPSEEAQGSGLAIPLPAAPAAALLPMETVEVKPTTPAGRIDSWQKKLLDLTLRNRLLNFPDSRKSIPFLCPDVGYLEDRLADGVPVRLISLPEQNPLGERDAALFREVHGRDLQRGFAAEALQRDELASPLDPKELEARLVELHRQARNDLGEGGANTLFLAVGFLRWRKKPTDERSYRAPLLLAPVRLERRSASARFTLRFHEDEPRFNATLLQFLEREFDLRLPQFSGDLPMDESGVDVPRLLAAVRQAVRDVPGMEVVDETALSTFSFAKFLMWKDLLERTDALRGNRVVRHLIDTPEQAFGGGSAGSSFRDERELDRHYAPSDIVCLLPSDSSQTAASLAAAEGHDFVIVGPPGTGKSQTIANMIANCLAVGKTVLFVAEKTAALDVVYRRLREHGLGNHCLELHSNKADRRHFLAQLKASWESGGQLGASEWVAVNEQLRVRRDELNAYVEALHRRHGNGWTAYRAIGIALRSRDAHAPRLSWPRHDAHQEAELREIERIVAEVGLAFASVRVRPALRMVDVTDWTSGWQEALLAAAGDLRGSADMLTTATAAFLAGIGLPPKDEVSSDALEQLRRLASALVDSAGHDVSVARDPDLSRLRPALAALRDAAAQHASALRRLSARYDRAALMRLDIDALEQQWRQATASMWPASLFGKRKVQKLLQGYALDGVADPERDLPLLRTLRDAGDAVAANPLAGRSQAFAGVDSDLARIESTLTLAEGLHAALALPAFGDGERSAVARAVTPALAGDANDRIRALAVRLRASADAFDTAMGRFAELAGRTPTMSGQAGQLAALWSALEELIASPTLQRDWAAWCRIRRQATSRDLGPLVDDIENGIVAGRDALIAFRLAYARWWLPSVLDQDPVLRAFRRFQHENAITDFREIDDLVRAQAAQRVIEAIAHELPAPQGVARNSELGLLRHQMTLQRPSRSIREMIGALPASFAQLAPCVMMSPLSIAQYLPPDQAPYDVVIFDEASQITTWDAVGAIARGRQTIIVGDPKQLPPTNFFGRSDEDEDVLEHERDLESILDEARAAGIPVRDLRWHYRSRSESLIAFSNHHYYGNRLVTFPSPTVDDQAVRLRKVPHGVYDRGKSRTNRIEAESLVGEAVARMTAWLALEERARPTLGIITFNAQQQSLILDLLDRARRAHPELEWFFADERIEPTIVKNLENVQGDERDVILFSITFSKDAADKRLMDFGALNREGGERRLNVAVTRARQELIVFSGFTADQIDPSRTKATGVHHLKTFLDFAERGAIALPAVVEGSVGTFESPFEEAIAATLERRGWVVVPQVGISGFRVDMGVRHPDLAGTYLAGVECDGATYHGSATARDRDKVREQVLRGLGWNIVRVWSTDWWFDPDGCAERLHASLDTLLEASRRKAEQTGATDLAGHWDMGHEIQPAAASPPDEPVVEPEPSPAPRTEVELVAVAEGAPVEVEVPAATARGVAADAARPPTPDQGSVIYRITDLAGFPAEPERFHEDDYGETLRTMVEAILDQEAPVRADILAQRIARAHGWLRTGARIREKIDLQLSSVDTTSESTRVFLWKRGSVADLMPYRVPYDAGSRRAVAEVPIAELAAVVVANRAILDEPDPALELARLLGIERLAAVSRARLGEAIERARAQPADELA